MAELRRWRDTGHPGLAGLTGPRPVIRNVLPRSCVADRYTLRVLHGEAEHFCRVTSIEPDGSGGFVIRAGRWEPGRD